MDSHINNHLVTLVGVLFAALVGGFFSFVNLISSKEQKISEFRQEWINSLRDSISKHISTLYYLSHLYTAYLAQDPSKHNRFEMTKGVEESYSKINETYNDIIFRINENEKKNNAKEINSDFLSALEVCRDKFSKAEFSEVAECCATLRKQTKPLLKLEWERVKSGERTYRYSKYTAIVVFSIGFIAFMLGICKILKFI